MIVLTIIIFTILVLLIILNIKKDGFNNVSDEQLQKHIDEIQHIQQRHNTGIESNLYYYPYNDIYNKYKKSMVTSLCKKKQAITSKIDRENKQLQLLEEKYQNLQRQISPDFNPMFGDFLQLNTYNSDNNENIKYLKVKRNISPNTSSTSANIKNTFQIFMDGNGQTCLEVDNYNRYKTSTCSDDNDKQKFYLDYAYDRTSYEDIVKNPKFRYPENPDLINYPVTLLRAKNGNCVNLYNDKISIEPCKYKSTQMFKMNPV